ncbi:ABC transporter permease [Paraburkholderia sp. CNPSo 3272]|uniref:ABC transporter permease n=1 Tax=Paraburkholderia sp. CNPSo 3272 TaxID=2940931 RepID=UPI0020B7C985|nr:ABC transporter permease [Paraburkholderia sp. CNPSo 3272]MCP3722411.1 ABC transporter permease [Paraburkholderia sp. CNPSo 3272]
MNRAVFVRTASTYGVIPVLFALVLFGAMRYERFLSIFNLMSLLRYNSMFALVSLGMCLVIMTGGIDLSVGTVAALSSVTSALVSPHGLAAGVAAGVGTGVVAGLANGLLVTHARLLPFIATLCSMLAASGLALLLSRGNTVSVDYDSGFTFIGQGNCLGLPMPALIAGGAFLAGVIVLNYTAFGRSVLAVGGGEEAARLMGLRPGLTKFFAYLASGTLAGLAGLILAAQFGSGQPTEGVGWELFAIAAVVVGGTLLTGGSGSILSTLAGVLLLGVLFNVLNFENGMGVFSISAYWQNVIRGAFLLVVILIQARLAGRPR